MVLTNIKTSIRTAQADAAVDSIDVGSGTAQGRLKIYTAAFGALLCTCNFSNPAFGAAASGVATASAISTGTAGASGTAAVGRVVDRDDATQWEFTVGTSGADLNLTNVTIATNDTVAISSFTFTQPAS